MGVVLFILGLVKFILLFILCAFALVFLLSAFIVLMPIRYDVSISYDKKLDLKINATWFFKILRVILTQGDKNRSFKILIFGKNIKDLFGRGRKKRKQRKKKVEKRETPEEFEDFTEDSDTGQSKNPIEEPPMISETLLADERKESIKEDIKEDTKRQTKKRRSEKPKKSAAPPENEDMRIDESNEESGGGIKEIWKKLKELWNYPDKELIIKAAVKLTKRLFKAIMPKKVKIRGTVGFDDPNVTGRALGALYAFSGMNRIDMELRGNFEEYEMNAVVNIAGKIVLWSFIRPLIMFGLTKPIRKIIMAILFRKDEENE